jgi:hypothetical protein
MTEIATRLLRLAALVECRTAEDLAYGQRRKLCCFERSETMGKRFAAASSRRSSNPDHRQQAKSSGTEGSQIDSQDATATILCDEASFPQYDNWVVATKRSKVEVVVEQKDQTEMFQGESCTTVTTHNPSTPS